VIFPFSTVKISATFELAPEDLREIDEAASAIQLTGDRYSEQMQKMTGI
jgi:hypothetical protein